MDKNGMFRITGRYKELIIGAGGENIAPVPIEDKFKVVCPGIKNILIIDYFLIWTGRLPRDQEHHDGR